MSENLVVFGETARSEEGGAQSFCVRPHFVFDHSMKFDTIGALFEFLDEYRFQALLDRNDVLQEEIASLMTGCYGFLARGEHQQVKDLLAQYNLSVKSVV